MNLPYEKTLPSQLAKLARPQNVVYPGLLSAGIAYVVSRSVVVAIACYLFFLAVYALAAGYNNIRDRETDRINQRRDNPLVAKQLPKSALKSFFWANLLLAVAAQLFLSQPESFILMLVLVALTAAYSHPKTKLQARGLWATLTLSVCYGGLPLALGLLQADDLNIIKSCLLIMLQITIVFPILLAKDYKDTKGDKATRKLTPLLLYGHRALLQIAIAISSIATLAWVVFAAKSEANSLFYGLAAGSYWLFVYRLHAQHGKISAAARKLATLILALVGIVLTHTVLL